MRKYYRYQKIKHTADGIAPGYTVWYMARGDKCAELMMCDDQVLYDRYARQHIARDLWQLRRDLRRAVSDTCNT